MSETKQRVQDPVCGMKIDPAAAAGREEWRGTHYHFCSAPCQAKFRGLPEKYITPPKRASGC